MKALLFILLCLVFVNPVNAQSWGFFGYGDDGPDPDDRSSIHDDDAYYDMLYENQKEQDYYDMISDDLFSKYLEEKQWEEYEKQFGTLDDNYYLYRYSTPTPKPKNKNNNTSSRNSLQDLINDNSYWLTKRWELNGKCLIKGNISFKTGEYIYHVPGWQDYDSTEINTSKGERWFCSEQEALNAGWRPPYYIGYRW